MNPILNLTWVYIKVQCARHSFHRIDGMADDVIQLDQAISVPTVPPNSIYEGLLLQSMQERCQPKPHVGRSAPLLRSPAANFCLSGLVGPLAGSVAASLSAWRAMGVWGYIGVALILLALALTPGAIVGASDT